MRINDILIAVVIIAVIVVLYYEGAKYGKSQLPDLSIPDNSGETKTPDQISGDSTRVHDDLNQNFLTFWGEHDGDLWSELVAYSDADLVNLSNYYTQQFKTSLYTDIKNTWSSPLQWSSITQNIKTVENRLINLGSK